MARHTEGDIEIKLQVRYYGLKATQYFSKFTTESDVMFREDLTSLKLPHPKRENTNLLSHGCVECSWPAVQNNGVLHNHIDKKSNPPDDLLRNLSISNITIKYIHPQKRKFKNYNTHSQTQPPNHHYSTSQVEKHPGHRPESVSLPFRKGQWEYNGQPYGTWDSYSRRPHKMLKLDPKPGDVNTDSQNPETAQPFPTFKNLPPLPPRKAPERIHVPTPTNTKVHKPSETLHEVEETSAFAVQVPPPDKKQAALPTTNIFGNRKPPDSTQTDASKSIPQIPNVFNLNQYSRSGQVDSIGNSPSIGTGCMQSISHLQGTFGIKTSPAVSDDTKMDVDPGTSSRDLGFRVPPKGPKAMEKPNVIPASATPARTPGEHNTNPVKASNSPPIKQEYIEDAIDFLCDTPYRRNSPDAHADTLPTPRTKPSRFQPVERPSAEEKNIQVDKDKDKGAYLVQDFLNSLKLKQSTGDQGPASDTTVQTEHPLPKVETREPPIPPARRSSSRSHPQIQPPTSVAQPKEKIVQQLDWYDGSDVPPFRGPQEVDTIEPSVLPTPPSSSALNAWASWFVSTSTPGNASNNLPAVLEKTPTEPPHLPVSDVGAISLAPSLLTQLQAVSSSSSSLSMANKRKRNTTHTKEELMAIQTLLREASDIKREIAAKMAREGVIISELKALNSNWVPRHIKLGHETPEETEAEILRLRSELRKEKQLREEAENAIMDVRRECKEPFIVPSLLDAFVELSKLTTRSLRPPSHASQFAATETDVKVAPRIG